MPKEYDLAVIGGGIVGLATAWTAARRRPRWKILLLEKEDHLARHQTGHNSGVIHSGVYYRPGSLKASLCVQGARALLDFCRTHGIPVERCGKVIVAASAEEFPRLEELYQRGQANGVPNLSRIGPERLKELEPHAAGLRALEVPGTAIVDFRKVAQRYAELFQNGGGEIRTGTKVHRIRTSGSSTELETSSGKAIRVRWGINCGGLQADLLAAAGRAPTGLQIVPFRGEYYELLPQRRGLVRGLIYPVPDPRFPFLGVHFTRRIDGSVEAGPNAVLALKREGYRKRDFNGADCWRMMTFPGFWKMTGRYWKTGLTELHRSFSKRAFTRALQRLIPEIQSGDLAPAPAGVRAQALTREGNLLDDFHLVEAPGWIHVCNAPSPAATASLAIGEQIAGLADRRFS